MITAIPIKNDKISSHFKKATFFQIFDQTGQLMSKIANPAHPDQGNDCSSNSTLIAEFERFNVKRVIVNNVGERMLTRLLPAGFEVWQTLNRSLSPAALVTGSEQLTPLNNPDQGRESKNYLEKQANGGCDEKEGCSDNCSKQNDNNEGRCCHTKAQVDQPKRPRRGLRRLLGF